MRRKRRQFFLELEEKSHAKEAEKTKLQKSQSSLLIRMLKTSGILIKMEAKADELERKRISFNIHADSLRLLNENEYSEQRALLSGANVKVSFSFHVVFKDGVKDTWIGIPAKYGRTWIGLAIFKHLTGDEIKEYIDKKMNIPWRDRPIS
nr:hypothetical protein [Tanacetum cinerariifolium]